MIKVIKNIKMLMSKEKCAFRVKKLKPRYIFVVLINSEEEGKKKKVRRSNSPLVSSSVV